MYVASQGRILPHKTKPVLLGKPLQIIHLAHLPGSIHRTQNPPVLSTLGVQLPLPAPLRMTHGIKLAIVKRTSQFNGE